jgi:hypothetical protein
MEDEVPDDTPPWDGGPDRTLPAGAITDHVYFLERLEQIGLAGVAGEDIAEALKTSSALMSLAAGEVAWEEENRRGLVVLWLPFFEDQRMHVLAGETVEHKEIDPFLRWRDTEAAIAVLSMGLPTRPVEFGFLADGQATVFPWYEFCGYYELPPQYVLAAWG